MAKYKQRRRKLRANVTFRFKKQKGILPPLCPSVPPPKPPVSPLNQSRPFCSWSLTLPDVTKVLRPLVTRVLCWYCWCQNSIIWLSQIFQVIGNAVFRSHLYLKELRERLEKLETEFCRLESVVQNKAVASLEKKSCQMSENVQHQLPAQVHRGLAELSSSHSQTLVPPAPPPPPPLPPPPRCVSKTDGAKKQDALLKTDMPVQITIKDLLNVKLKKTESYPKIEKKRSPLQKRRALITISDLQSISLKSKPPATSNCAANSSSTPSRSSFDFRKHLRKVSIKRSPGGTPLINKENLETGTGLTPIMTQALRRKFQLAHPQSPSPSHFPSGSSFEEPS